MHSKTVCIYLLIYFSFTICLVECNLLENILNTIVYASNKLFCYHLKLCSESADNDADVEVNIEKDDIYKTVEHGFDDGINRVTLLGKQFPIVTLHDGKEIDLYTYACTSVDDPVCDWSWFSVSIKKYNKFLIDRYPKLRSIHLFIVCESLQGQHENCPDPCYKGKDCAKNGKHSKCVTINWGLYNNDYMCTCDKDYIWNENLKKCEIYDACVWKGGIKCDDFDKNICVANENGTYKCMSSEEEKEMEKMNFKCQYRCQEKIAEICREELNYFYNLIYLSGKVCQHGTCVIDEHNAYGYNCKCDDGWVDDPGNHYPDCSLSTKTICYTLNHACVHGNCSFNAKHDKYECKCDSRYIGESCNELKPEWLPWQSWSSCHANCNETGYQIRNRGCNVAVAKCKFYNSGKAHDNGVYDRQYVSCYRPCNETSSFHFEWSSWSKCKADCQNNQVYGYRTRKLVCKHKKDDYKEHCEFFSYLDTQVEECYHSECLEQKIKDKYNKVLSFDGNGEQFNIKFNDIYTWTKWSECITMNTSCSYGYKLRRFTCNSESAECARRNMEIKSCISVCTNQDVYPWSTWSKWSLCIPDEMNRTSKTFCQRERYCYRYDDKDMRRIEIQVELCDDRNMCNPKQQFVDIKYIYDKQGIVFANAFEYSLSQGSKDYIDQMRTFLVRSKYIYEQYNKS